MQALSKTRALLKTQNNIGEMVESIACPMCGSQDESLIHFVCECVELNDWRREIW